jgi:hypothetical protein
MGDWGHGHVSLRWYEILFTPDDASKTLTKFGGYTPSSFTSAGNYMQSVGGFHRIQQREGRVGFSLQIPHGWHMAEHLL